MSESIVQQFNYGHFQMNYSEPKNATKHPPRDQVTLTTFNAGMLPEWINSAQHLQTGLQDLTSKVTGLFFKSATPPSPRKQLLQSPKARAPHIAKKLAGNGDDIYCGQEVFSVHSSSLLTEALKDEYYVLSNIGCGAVVNSGLFFASTWPIKHKDVWYGRFNNLGGEDNLSDKGILRVPVNIPFENGFKQVIVYTMHLQAKFGPQYSAIRNKQALAALELIKSDYKQQRCPIFLLGDFNIVDTEMDGSKPMEYTNLEKSFFSYFHDLYLQDHNLSGKRTQGESRYLLKDNQNTTLFEPMGSFYNMYNFGKGEEYPGFRYDYALLYDLNKKGSLITKFHTELRRIMEPDLSDHLPLTTVVDTKELFTHFSNLDSDKGSKDEQ